MKPSVVPAGTRRPGAPSRAGNRALWILQTIDALGFVLAALEKLTGASEVVATFNASDGPAGRGTHSPASNYWGRSAWSSRGWSGSGRRRSSR
jgi:uncharacterized membrane protein